MRSFYTNIQTHREAKFLSNCLTSILVPVQRQNVTLAQIEKAIKRGKDAVVGWLLQKIKNKKNTTI